MRAVNLILVAWLLGSCALRPHTPEPGPECYTYAWPSGVSVTQVTDACRLPEYKPFRIASTPIH